VLAIFCISVAAYEVIMSLSTFLRIYFVRRNLQQYTGDFDIETDRHLVFTGEVQNQIESIKSRIACALKIGGPCPVVLICGASGTGKTSAAKHLTKVSELPVRDLLSVEILLSVETKLAPSFLRLALAPSNRKPRSLILDDADAMIYSRDRLIQKHGSHSLLYTFLEASRHASFKSTVILTSELSLEEIDRAILDRIDTTITLKPPSAFFRFLSLLSSMENKLSDILTDEAKNDVGALAVLNESEFKDLLAVNYDAPETSHPTSTMFTDLSSKKFDVKFCVNAFVSYSEGASFREVDKFVMNVQLQALGSER
jgi:hypothetical protein